LNPNSSTKSGIGPVSSFAELKVRKDRPMTSKVRVETINRPGGNRPKTAKATKPPVIENIRELINDDSDNDDKDMSTQNISPYA
jgi:hypothetical protein